MNLLARIKQLRELADQATPGPWMDGGKYSGKVRYGEEWEGIICQHVHSDNCMQLIAVSRTAIPMLCTELEKAIDVLQRIEHECAYVGTEDQGANHVRQFATTLLKEWGIK